MDRLRVDDQLGMAYLALRPSQNRNSTTTEPVHLVSFSKSDRGLDESFPPFVLSRSARLMLACSLFEVTSFSVSNTYFLLERGDLAQCIRRSCRTRQTSLHSLSLHCPPPLPSYRFTSHRRQRDKLQTPSLSPFIDQVHSPSTGWMHSSS